MVRLQHRSRRGPGEGITVESTRYQLDDQGIVEVPEDHARVLLAMPNTQWAPPGAEVAQPVAAVPTAAQPPR